MLKGVVVLTNLTSDPTGTVAGQMYFNTTNNVIRVFNGSAWGDM